MNIYVLTRIDEIVYDENEGFVIRAKTEDDARELANENYADEDQIWADKEKVACSVVEKHGPKEIILLAFNPG